MTLPSMASSSSSSSSSASQTPSQLKQTHHLITIRVSPQHEEDLIVSTLYLRDSLFVWCGTTERGREIEAEIRDQQEAAASSSQTSSAVELDKDGSNASQDIEAAALASLSEEERRQLEVDRQVDEEIAKAMEAAGRTDEDDPTAATTGTPQGYLAREWAMAMHNTRGGGTGGGTGAATSLFRSAADVAAPMARRLARRLNVAQVHLSLSLPPDFGANIGAGGGAGAGSSPLLALEKGIEEAVIAGSGR